MSDVIQIRNSTVDFLVFTRDAGEEGIEVRVQNGDVWLTQKGIAELFGVDRSVVTKHLGNVFAEKELDENSVCAKFAHTADDGKKYQYKFYSLTAIMAVGYRTGSDRATQFRQWASKLDAFLQFNDAEIFQDKGKVTAEIAKAFAESEFEKYRVIQDKKYQSDFDRMIGEIMPDKEKPDNN